VSAAPPAVSIPGLALRPATRDDWDAIASAMNRAHRADGVEEIQSGQELAADLEPIESFRLGRDVLVAAVDRRIVAFACGIRVVRDEVLVGETWGGVTPEVRRRGLGTVLWRATRDRLAAEMALDPRPGPRELRAYALEIEPGAIALYADQGYVPIRFGFEMRRSITGALPDHPLPPGLELRPVTPDQHRAIFDADEEAFRDHWGRRQADEGDFRARFGHPDLDTTMWCVAWDGDQVAGSVMNYVFAAENAQLGIRRGWLDHVSVRRPWRGRGLAKALCAESFRVLRARGKDEAWLGVDSANPTGALPLYEALGFTVVRRWYAYGRPVDRPAPPGWRSGDEAGEEHGGAGRT
jgi:mycothiol synthase